MFQFQLRFSNITSSLSPEKKKRTILVSGEDERVVRGTERNLYRMKTK